MQISRFNSPNYGSRGGHIPDIICCHITDGGYMGSIATLCGQDDRQVSSNFVVSRNGEIAQLVDIRNAAWCNGTQYSNPLGARYVGRAISKLVRQRRVNANLYTVSIECVGDETTHGILTDKQFNAVVWLIQYIKRQVKLYYGTEIKLDRAHIIGHCEITPREKPDCPGRSFPYDRIISAFNGLQPLICIDEPGKIVSGEFTVRGWALGVERVDIYADGKGIHSIHDFSARPDVAAVHPDYKTDMCGYSAVAKLSKGTHTISVYGIKGSSKTVLNRKIKVK